jgi:hypothetical protein
MGEVTDAVGIQFRLLNTSRGPANITRRVATALADTQDGVAIVDKGTQGLGWKFSMSCTASANIVQEWKVTALTLGNIDADSATTITVLKMEDQFGNLMSLPSSGSGITVGQAA